MSERWVKATDAESGVEGWVNVARCVTMFATGDGTALIAGGVEQAITVKEEPAHFLPAATAWPTTDVLVTQVARLMRAMEGSGHDWEEKARRVLAMVARGGGP